ncbi:hypothetical protein PYCCODRAFT_1215232 [Trametes coccinea BRFM310]|uniref:PX domain-containing protein n=1 Tax=Trametes coccinea (strain BRFM310) TaxID=1353009 RepID=A0A1Y2I6U7_TRAC3|nr:hypothetical protein PYCCODRAFT_1215232 [Trametes coccinea BRFM310]
MENLVGDFFGGPGTGALGGPPTHHNYKRAVYRAPPKEFTVEVLQPTKFGSGYCYGMRITALQMERSDRHSTVSGGSSSSFSEYEVWRRWEDCLWFQEILETEYALMARQKRARLVAGKGVKKNGVYIHSDQAASFESLPPGPDANMIAKDIHDIVPRLTKKGTLFRASQATIEQRGREFESLINTLFQDDVPMLVKELRESRLCRDFFGYWRRDLDHDRKRGKTRASTGSNDANGTASARQSVASSAFSMYFSASNISLQLPGAFADLPPSPAVPSFQGSSRPGSMVRDNTPHRRSAGNSTAQYAASDSSASSGSLPSASQSPQSATSAPHDLTFFVSERGSLALALPDEDSPVDYFNVPHSAPPRVQPGPWGEAHHRPFPSEDQGKPEDDEPYLADSSNAWPDVPSSEFHHGLQALPEDSELVPSTSITPRPEIEEVPRVPVRRQRNNSCPDRTNRNCIVYSQDAPRSAGPTSGVFSTIDGLHVETDSRRLQHSEQLRRGRAQSESLRDPHTPTTATTSSRAPSSLFSSFSADVSRRSSWRTSMASVVSESSFAPSFTSSFTNGSCADFNRPRIASPESVYSDDGDFSGVAAAADEVGDDDGRETALGYHQRPQQYGHQHRESVTTIGSMLSDFSIDSSILPRSFTPPPDGYALRRSLSAGSRRAPSIMSGTGLGLPGSEELWYERQQDSEFIDAYFYDPGIHAPTVRPEEPPKTPSRKPPQEPFRKEVASPDRFPKPFRDRPPGQFHLPWSPPESSRPSTPSSVSASSYTTSPTLPPAQPTAVPAPVRASVSPPPATPSTPTGGESITLKAVLSTSIVLLRISRSMPLAEVRDRLRDKLAVQEGLKLTPTFVIGWAPPDSAGAGGRGGLLALRGRPRSNSASSVGSLSPQSLRYVYTEQDWQAALAACASGKMTVRLFNARPI